MIFEVGEKVHIIDRRQFADDVIRHFVGEIIRCTERAIRVKGHVWILDQVGGKWTRKPETRERVVYCGERHTINIVPREVNLSDLKYVSDPYKGLLVTDGKAYSPDITEFSPMR